MTRLDQAGQSGGNVVAEKRVDFAYNATGQFTDIDRFKDLDGGSTHHVVETDFVYDGLGRLTDLTHTHDTTTIADYGWTFDSYSRVTQMSFTSSTGNSGTSDYSYDDTGQVTAADHDFQTDESYSYDENGNRTLTGYTTGDNNQLTSDGTFNYTYDDEGNRLTRTRISGTADDYTTEYEWDHDNRLTKLTYKNNGGTVTKEIEYGYDLFGRRISKTIDWDGAGGGSAEEVHYIYDGDDILLAFDESGDLTNRYLHGPAVDQILADEQVTSLTSAGDVLWPLADNLGSVRDIVDSTGAVENHITYDSFGNVTSETDDTVDHIYAYTGRDRDEESDLQYNRARYYDATVGRWISEDPIGFAAGDSNLARYVGNFSTGARDPSGLVQTVSVSQEELVEPQPSEDPAGLKKRLIDERIIGPFSSTREHAGLVIGIGWEVDVFLNAGPLPVGVGGSVGPIVYVGWDADTGKITTAYAIEYTGQAGVGYGIGSFEGVVKVFNAPDVETVLGQPSHNVGVSAQGPIGGDLDIIWNEDCWGMEIAGGPGAEAHVHRGIGDCWNWPGPSF